MALLLKGGVLYLHIPKTGGNWLTAMLLEQGLVVESVGHKHATYDLICGISAGSRGAAEGTPAKKKKKAHGVALPWKMICAQLSRPPPPDPTPLANVLSFVCVVRHPLRWYESWYRYQTGRAWVHFGKSGSLRHWHPCSVLNDVQSKDFNAFMSDVKRTVPGFVGSLYSRYADGSRATILRNESLADDVAAFGTTHGYGFSPEQLRSSGRIGESPVLALEWDPDVLAETISNERPALTRFGYAP